MTAWHERIVMRLLLRAAGALLIAIACFAVSSLNQLVHRHGDDGAWLGQIALAGLIFCGLTSGSALLFVGHDMFDEIRVSTRWRTCGIGKKAAGR